MSIKVEIHPYFLRRYTNDQATVEVNGSTVGQCLKHLVKQFPSIEKMLFNRAGKLLDYLDIYVNEESAYPEELIKLVKDGDKLHLLYIIGGG